uniref:Cytokine receptor-like factor 3 n=1 Tax=Hucho hucho TaxID=62062 RepID=A0A4W5L6P9_9TELE
AIRCGLGEKEDKLGSFTKKALQIQLDSLPEVPVLVDVPCVSAQLDDSLLYAVRERVSRHGSVSSHPPVQIEELQERPGSVLVRWCKVDDEFAVQDYRLQYRRSVSGQYLGQKLFNIPEVIHFFEILYHSTLTRNRYSPWFTPDLTWCPGSEGYILSSRRNIAMRSDSSPNKAGVLYSNAPTYFCGQTLTFKISATGQVDKRDSIGVCVGCEGEVDSLQRDQAVCISTNGAVFVNGKEMTNQLPSITLGSAVTFDMEMVNLLPISNNNNLSDGGNFKLRVTIGSGNREVVFDWLLDQGVDCLFFGCSLAHPGWKVLVF